MTVRERVTSARLALAVLALLFLGSAGVLGLTEPTETRYAEISREMKASGDWLVPRLDGIAHFHKPPLTYWLTAAGMAALGENAWGARVPAILAALVLLACVARLVRRFGPVLAPEPHDASGAGAPPALDLSRVAVWVAGTSLLLLGPGRTVSCDPYLAAAVAGFWCLAPSTWALAVLGIGFLLKGPVVFVPTALPILAVAVWERLRRDRSPGAPPVTSWLGPPRGWIAFAAIAAPWFIALVVIVPGLLEYLLRTQLWQRYTSGVHHREGGWWYFVAVLLGGIAPWTPALFAGLRAIWRRRSQREARLLLAWLVAPLVFFSFSGSKLPAYLLPCLPAAALIATAGLAQGGRAVALAVAALLGAIAIAGAVFGPREFARIASGAALPALGWVAFAMIAASAAFVARRRFAPGAALFAVAMTLVLVTVAPYDAELGAPRRLALAIAAQRTADEPIVVYRRFNAGIPFHLRSRVFLLDVPRELQFEHGASPVIETAELRGKVRSGRVWIVGPEAAIEELAGANGLRWNRVASTRRDAAGFLSVP